MSDSYSDDINMTDYKQPSKKRKTQEDVLEQLLKSIKENRMIDSNVIDNIQTIIESFKKQENTSDILLSELIIFLEKVKNNFSSNGIYCSENYENYLEFIQNIDKCLKDINERLRSQSPTPTSEKNLKENLLKSPLQQAESLVLKNISSSLDKSPSPSKSKSTSLNSTQDNEQIQTSEVFLTDIVLDNSKENVFSTYDILLLKFLNFFKDQDIYKLKNDALGLLNTNLSDEEIQKIREIEKKIY